MRTGMTLTMTLNNIDWDITLDCQEPDIMWSNFKNAVFDKVNAHITQVYHKVRTPTTLV